MYSCNIVSIDANVGHPVGDISCYSDTVGECEPVYVTQCAFCRNSIFKNELCFLERAITAFFKERSLICFGKKIKE